jgi:hypothetical protein
MKDELRFISGKYSYQAIWIIYDKRDILLQKSEFSNIKVAQENEPWFWSVPVNDF